MTPETVAELRRLAEAATPGPWGACDDDYEVIVVMDDESNHWPGSYAPIARGFEQGDDEGLTDALYVAAANPAAVLALLDAAAERERMREGRDDSPRDEDGWATPGQMWAMLLDSPLNERMALLRAALRAMDAEHRCVVGFHHEAVQQRDALAAKVERARALADLIDRHTEFERDPVDFRDASHGGSWDDVADRIRAALDEEPQP